MTESELISACLRNDKSAQKQIFEQNYGALAATAMRYSKSKVQADDMINKGFLHLFSHLSSYNSQHGQTLQDWLKREFVLFAVNYIRNIRSEYYVASTIRVTDHPKEASYDLFADNDRIDYSHTDFTTLVNSLQKLVPSQRVAFNLHVIDGYTIHEVSEMLETSEQTIKSNLEKGRYNLQKNIEKTIKSAKNEQPV
jgi:RNA polymerase sigma-70 factor, ECF subfamily